MTFLTIMHEHSTLWGATATLYNVKHHCNKFVFNNNNLSPKDLIWNKWSEKTEGGP